MTTFLSSINFLVFVMDPLDVYCEVGNEMLHYFDEI